MEINLIGNHLIVNFYGDLDSFSVANYKERLEKTIKETSFKKMAMDFSNVKFIDSSGIALILNRYQQLKELGVPLTLYGISNTLDRLFKLSGIWKIIENGDKKEKVVPR